MRGFSLVAASLILAGCTAAPAAVTVTPETSRSISPGKSTTQKPAAIATPAAALAPKPADLPKPVEGTTLVAAGGLNLIGLDGATLIGMDGGTFSAANVGFTKSDRGPGSPSIAGRPTEEGGAVITDEASLDRAGAVAGTVRLPAAIAKAGRTDQLPVGGARVAICELGSEQAIEEPAVADAKGAFAMPAGMPAGLYVARAKVKVGDQAYQLAAIVALGAAGVPALELDAGSTLLAARFEQVYAEDPPALDAPGLDPIAWNTAAREFGGRVPVAALAAGTTPAALVAGWAAYAKDQPDMKGDDLLEAFVIGQVKAGAAQ